MKVASTIVRLEMAVAFKQMTELTKSHLVKVPLSLQSVIDVIDNRGPATEWRACPSMSDSNAQYAWKRHSALQVGAALYLISC